MKPGRAIIVAVSLATLAAGSLGQQTKPEKWQTDWKAYVGELGKDLQKGTDPDEDIRFKGKQVEFEGILRTGVDQTKPDKPLDIEMEPLTITVMLKLFPMVDAQKAGEKTGTVTLNKVSVTPAAGKIDGWQALQPGSRVRFRATVGNGAAMLVTTSDIGGLVFLFLDAGEVLPGKFE
jgi:hypothetical protein